VRGNNEFRAERRSGSGCLAELKKRRALSFLKSLLLNF